MIRRNLIFAMLAVPAAAGSAVMLTSIDLREETMARSQSEVQPVSSDPIARAAAVDSLNGTWSLFAPVQTSIGEQPVSEPGSGAIEPARLELRHLGIAAGFEDQAAIAWTAGDIHMPAQEAAAIGQSGNRRRAFSTDGASNRTETVTPHRSLDQAGGGVRVARPSSLQVPRPRTVPPRTEGMSMDAEFWWFEPLPLSIVFGEAVSGQPVPLAVQIINDEELSRIFDCQVSIYAIGNEGETLGEVRPAIDIAISVDGETTVQQDLPPLQPDELLPWLSETQSFNVVATGVDRSGGDPLASDNYLYVPVPSIFVTLTPDTDVEPGDLVRVTVESDAPLGIALSNVQLRFNGGTQLMQDGQIFLDEYTVSDVVISLGDFPAESELLHEEWFVAVDPAWAVMNVQLEAQEIVPQYSCAELWNESDWIDVGDGDDVEITVSLTPDTDVEPGDLVRVTIQSDGPLPIALTNVTVRLNGGTQLLQDGQTFLDEYTVSDVVVVLGDFAAESDLLHEEWFVAVDPDWAVMSVQLEADEVVPQYGWAQLWGEWDVEETDEGDDR